MSQASRPTLHYKRSHFATQLPVDFLYTPSHAWLENLGDNLWRVGLTKFAVRMLGEMVDHGYEIQSDAQVEAGQIIGWIEGFKAISDLFCVVEGEFKGGNSLLREDIQVVNRKPYGDGWLYTAWGRPDARCIEVHAYRDLLDRTINKILEQEKAAESAGE